MIPGITLSASRLQGLLSCVISGTMQDYMVSGKCMIPLKKKLFCYKNKNIENNTERRKKESDHILKEF